MEWIMGLGCVAVVLGFVIVLTPRKVSYIEQIEIAAPTNAIYDHIRFQERLMHWSAWPSETGSTCACEGNDGTVGARTVFFDKNGQHFGQQEVVTLEQGRRIVLTVQSKGPPQRPLLTFELEPIAETRTRVLLQFENTLSYPFNVLLRLFGIVRWTRSMHRKDLNGLKRYSEPPHRTYTDEPATELASA
jgi:uncharacterized protein YndB with AHSA1/START domain